MIRPEKKHLAVLTLLAAAVFLFSCAHAAPQVGYTFSHDGLLPDKIRAIAAVTAQIPAAVAPLCRSESGVSLAVFNGTEDPWVPYNGGQITVLRRQRGEVLSTDETVRIWRQKNQCHPEARVSELADLVDDGTRVTRIEYSRCKNKSKVILYRIEGGGHTWPDGRQYLAVRRIGRTTRDINGCDEIWQFFKNLK